MKIVDYVQIANTLLNYRVFCCSLATIAITVRHNITAMMFYVLSLYFLYCIFQNRINQYNYNKCFKILLLLMNFL